MLVGDVEDLDVAVGALELDLLEVEGGVAEDLGDLAELQVIVGIVLVAGPDPVADLDDLDLRLAEDAGLIGRAGQHFSAGHDALRRQPPRPLYSFPLISLTMIQ